MKTIFGIIAILLITNSANCQNSFTRKVSVSGFTGDTVIMYIDNMDLQGELPRPLDSNDELVGIVEFKLSSEEKLIKLVVDIFSGEEIQELISSQCYLKTVSFSNGKIVSAYFGFVNKKPDVPLSKLAKLSDIIKKEFILQIEFEGDVVSDGYVKSTYWLFLELKKFIE